MSKKDVLQFLQENRTEYVSGEALCRRLGITRAAVWKAVAALRKEGYTIDARPSRGYRLSAAPDAPVHMFRYRQSSLISGKPSA